MAADRPTPTDGRIDPGVTGSLNLRGAPGPDLERGAEWTEWFTGRRDKGSVPPVHDIKIPLSDVKAEAPVAEMAF